MAGSNAIAHPAGRQDRDITRRKGAEEEVRRVAEEADHARRLFLAVLKHVPEGVAIADVNSGTIRFVNDKAVEMTGWRTQSAGCVLPRSR